MRNPADKHKAQQEMTRAGARRLWPYLHRHLGYYISGGLLLILTNLFVTSLPFLFSKMVTGLQADPVQLPHLRSLLLVALAVALAAAMTRVLSRLLIFNTGRHIEYELRMSLFNHMQNMAASVFARRATGDLISRATNDLSSVRLLFGFAMLHVMNTPILFLMAIGMMTYINPRLTPAVLAVYPIVILGVRRYSRNMFDLTQQVQSTLGDISAAAQENFSDAQVVKSYTLEDHEIEKMRRLSQRYLTRSVKLALTRNILFNTMTLIVGMSELVLLGFGGWEIIQGRLTMGDLVAFNIYLGMMVWPTMAFGFILSVWQRGMGAMSRIEEILAEPAEPETLIQVAGSLWKRPGFWKGDIEIQGLSWGYPVQADSTNGRERIEVLKDVSMRIAGGKVTALIGTTGCGKSTLARLLTRLHNPPAGTITMGGTDLTAIPLVQLRSNLGLAEQESFLFSLTVDENIGFGRRGVTHEEIVRAARNAELARDLEEFPRGYETPVGERGITLSGGQRQRTAIARLLVYGAPVVIFDDSLSAVDLKTEERILSHLRTQLADRTVLLITHRIATAGNADWIYAMDQGRIVEQGTHEMLLASGGLYSRLAEIQQLSEDLETAP